MEKPLRFSLLLTLFLGFSLPVHAQKGPSFRLTTDIFGTVIPHNFVRTNNVPIELRQVLSHPDDDWYYGSERVLRTIPYDSVRPGTMIGFGFGFGPEVVISRLRLKSGFNWLMPVAPTIVQGTQTIQEINQYGRPTAGEGTTLVYYGIKAGARITPGYYNEASFRVLGDFSAIVGYGRERYNVILENGWDRWGKFETNKSYHVSKNETEKIYLGFSWWPDRDINEIDGIAYVIAGKARSIVTPVNDVRGLTVNYRPSWFVGIGSSVSWKLWHK